MSLQFQAAVAAAAPPANLEPAVAYEDSKLAE